MSAVWRLISACFTLIAFSMANSTHLRTSHFSWAETIEIKKQHSIAVKDSFLMAQNYLQGCPIMSFYDKRSSVTDEDIHSIENSSSSPTNVSLIQISLKAFSRSSIR